MPRQTGHVATESRTLKPRARTQRISPAGAIMPVFNVQPVPFAYKSGKRLPGHAHGPPGGRKQIIKHIGSVRIQVSTGRAQNPFERRPDIMNFFMSVDRIRRIGYVIRKLAKFFLRFDAAVSWASPRK